MKVLHYPKMSLLNLNHTLMLRQNHSQVLANPLRKLECRFIILAPEISGAFFVPYLTFDKNFFTIYMGREGKEKNIQTSEKHLSIRVIYLLLLIFYFIIYMRREKSKSKEGENIDMLCRRRLPRKWN